MSPDPDLVTNPWRFASGYREAETNLYKFGTLYYDQTLGRFTQMDLEFGEPSVPASLNRYLYAEGNPVNFVDPQGTQCSSAAIFSISLALLGLIVAAPALLGSTVVVADVCLHASSAWRYQLLTWDR